MKKKEGKIGIVGCVQTIYYCVEIVFFKHMVRKWTNKKHPRKTRMRQFVRFKQHPHIFQNNAFIIIA